MRLFVTPLLLALCGCSYETSFVICNAGKEALTIAYQLKDGAPTNGLFSIHPQVYPFTFDDGDVELGERVMDIPYDNEGFVSITIQPGIAVLTGSEINRQAEGSYGDVDRLLLVQQDDTTVISGTMLSDLDQDLGSYRGIVIDGKP